MVSFHDVADKVYYCQVKKHMKYGIKKLGKSAQKKNEKSIRITKPNRLKNNGERTS